MLYFQKLNALYWYFTSEIILEKGISLIVQLLVILLYLFWFICIVTGQYMHWHQFISNISHVALSKFFFMIYVTVNNVLGYSHILAINVLYMLISLCETLVFVTVLKLPIYKLIYLIHFFFSSQNSNFIHKEVVRYNFKMKNRLFFFLLHLFVFDHQIYKRYFSLFHQRSPDLHTWVPNPLKFLLIS